MNSMGKRRWDSMVSNSSLDYTVHGGSVPNLLSPPRSEGLATLKKRLSMEVLRGWAPDLGSLSMGLNLNLSTVKWPSLVTVCKWKQSLAEKLKKKHCGTEDQSQIRQQRGAEVEDQRGEKQLQEKDGGTAAAEEHQRSLEGPEDHHGCTHNFPHCLEMALSPLPTPPPTISSQSLFTPTLSPAGCTLSFTTNHSNTLPPHQ
ncbi:hypothetical protein KUCAC02_003280 [Chaenocephalus aceratus]|uniref:Uncharacterized protein n=1 Tax=Chaenocephalus aceratus TaxID=36190 RepID=A0ACB9WK34_CHAAC|nr:hypothetical protein KUCAC02_003280 [Chaenocephalus aceratus]